MSQVKVKLEIESDDLTYCSDCLEAVTEDTNLDFTATRNESGGIVHAELVGDSQEALLVINKLEIEEEWAEHFKYEVYPK